MTDVKFLKSNYSESEKSLTIPKQITITLDLYISHHFATMNEEHGNQSI
jgi:hypothetical protein